MRWKSVLVGAAITAAAFTTAGRVFSGDQPSGPPMPSPEELKMMQPGPEHQRLGATVGTWEGKGTYMGATWTSELKGRMVMGGRFLQLNETMTIPGAPEPMHMLMYVGFDNLKQKYVTFGVSEMGTGFMTAEGTYDAAKKGIEMRGSEPRPGGKQATFHYTVSDPADGAFRIDMYMDDGSGDKQMMVAEYKKK